MSTLSEIINETEKNILRLKQRNKIEEDRLKGKGFTKVSLTQHRGWFNLSLKTIKAGAYDKIVKMQKCSDSTTEEIENE